MGSAGPLYIRTGPLGKAQGLHRHEPDSWYGSRTPLCRVRATHGRVLGFWDKEYPDLNQDQAGRPEPTRVRAMPCTLLLRAQAETRRCHVDYCP
jgi:hypothetical protein